MIVIYRLFIKDFPNLFYIGSTENLKKRTNTHKCLLLRGKHFNFKLQEFFDKSESKEVVSEIISESTEENRYFDEYNAIINHSTVYNLLVSPKKFGDAISEHPKKKEIVARITSTLNLMHENLTQEEKCIKWGRSGEKNPNWRGGTSVSHCSCGNVKSLTANTCGNCRVRSGEKNPFFGKKHSEEVIKKIAESNKGRKPKNSIKVSINGVIYNSAIEASRHINCVAATIFNRIKAGVNGYEFVSQTPNDYLERE